MGMSIKQLSLSTYGFFLNRLSLKIHIAIFFKALVEEILAV